MKRLLIAAAGALALAGCATSEMQSYVGQPLQIAIARRGPPAFVFDMPDGRRAFQWEITSSGVTPRMTTGQANIYAPPGAFGSVNYNQMTTGGNAYSQTCRYTMYAIWQDNAWVFTGYEQPPLSCL